MSSLFGPAGETRPRKDLATIKRRSKDHEKWADAILPADAEAGTLETPTSRRPLLWLVAGVVVVAAILAAQLFHLQVVEGKRNLGLADGNRLRNKITRAPRGVIYDRTGGILAQNLGSFDVSVIPSLLPRSESARQVEYLRVAELLNISEAEVLAKVEADCEKTEQAGGKPSAEAVNDCLSKSQPQLVKSGVDRDTALNFDQSSSEVIGFSLDINPIRQYLDGGSLAATLGYSGRVTKEELDADKSYLPTDYIGKTGVEAQYEKVLRGQNGYEQTEVDASGRPIKLLATITAQPGNNLVLSIDREMQSQLQTAIQKQMEAAHATRASGVAINPKTGEVLALVSLPTYDNNLFARGISADDYNKLLKNPAQPLFDKAVGGAYPSGSIIKPLVASAALQEHVINTTTTIEDKGHLDIPNQYNPSITYTFNGWEHSGLGQMNVFRAIAMSSDIYFYTVGGGFGNFAGLGVNRLTAYYQKFGLGSKTGLDLPGETAGRVPTPEWKKKVTGESWYLGDTYNISVGQGDILVSPLQMAVAEAAVANGGELIKPHLVNKVTDSNGATLQEVSKQIVRKGFIDPNYLEIVRQAMRQTVESGTACCKFDQEVPVHVAGKTGSAETDPGKNKAPHSWFTSFAPYEDPQIVTVVLIENSGEGAEYAAPATREFLTWCFKRSGGCVR